MRIWKRGGERAPHKPLLVIYALSRAIQGEDGLIAYDEVKEHLTPLLKEFGPHRSHHRPQYPFVRLVRDEIWDLQAKCCLDPARDPSDRVLIENEARGGFKKEIASMLQKDGELARELIEMMLEQNFPPTLHKDILQAVGLNLTPRWLSKRDPKFRERILRAYENQCSVCGFDVHLGRNPVCLEAAHIKWHQAGGPDIEQNGIALCTMHHNLFDRGAFTINHSMQLQVAETVHGTKGLHEWLMRYHGEKVEGPQRPEHQPRDSYIDWHVREVFKGYAEY